MKPRRMASLAALALAVATLVGCSAPPRENAAAPARPLDEWLGAWHGVRRADDGSAEPISILVEAVPGGEGQFERLEVDVDPPYVGFVLRSRLDDGGRWVMLYGNASRPAFARLEADVPADGAVTWTSATPGRGRESRLVCSTIEADRWTRTQQVSDDGGATWRVHFTDELVRGPRAPTSDAQAADAVSDARTAAPASDPLASLAGHWTGRNALWLMPTSPVSASSITVDVSVAERTHALAIAYTWADGDTPHDGLLLVARDASGAATGAAWVDSFHTGRGIMTLDAASAPDGGVLLATTYPAPPGPDWGWEIAIVPESRDAWSMVMHNIPPETSGHPTCLAVEAHLVRTE
ncbi:MAG: DUF1579 family protein [Planctomycetes bacterium]|nr:DUF1579 family protein [Planctomycetota bacterium]